MTAGPRTATPTHPAGLPARARSAVLAGVVGNWVDNIHVFLPLTALAPALDRLVGPGAAASVGPVVVIAMLLGRPVGGVVLGRVADRVGRARTTRWSIAGTAACSLAIACLPSHAVLGGATLVLLLALRLVGGVLVAGEYSAAVPLTMEWSAPRRRGLLGGAILSMAPWAQAGVALAVSALLALLGTSAYAAWGWRVLFGAAGLASLGMLAYYHRRVEDAPEPEAQSPQDEHETGGGDIPRRATVRDLLAGRWARAFWQCLVMMTGLWLLTDTTVLILTSRLGQLTGLSPGRVGTVMAVASAAQALAMVAAGGALLALGAAAGPAMGSGQTDAPLDDVAEGCQQ